MGKAKDIVLRPISSKEGNAFIKRVHYSGKCARASHINIGVYYLGKIEGVFLFGQSINKHATVNIVEGTRWQECTELLRLAFTDILPRNSESRAISIAMKLIKIHAPQLKWVVSYADASQCGDGTIYRAAGFVLTSINENRSMWELPDGEVVCSLVFNPSFSPGALDSDRPNLKRRYGHNGSEPATAFLKRIGAKPIPGYQLRYIYFLDPSYRERLTVPELPYSEIERMGAGMYKGIKRGRGEIDSAPDTNPETGGASPTRPLLDMTGGEPELIEPVIQDESGG